MDLKHVVPDMEKTFGRLTFGGEGEAEVTRGRNSRPLSRTYNLFSDVQRADDYGRGRAGKSENCGNRKEYQRIWLYGLSVDRR